jgi:spore protease
MGFGENKSIQQINSMKGAVPMKSGQRRSIRTDLALETRELLHGGGRAGIPGVETDIEEADGITTTWVRITNAEGAEAMGKPVGNYVTIESEHMKGNDVRAHEEIIRLMARKLGELHKLPKGASVLAAGLGNWQVTPDALGPKVIRKLMVTRHMQDSMPEELKGGLRSVAAITPGVMGITGIESGDIIKGVAGRIRPELIIAVDALAARQTSRINATIQMTDTGISPGAGLGNRRMRLNKKTLGVPVIAIGVPTVVDAATLVGDTIDRILRDMGGTSQDGSFGGLLGEMEDDEMRGLITELLDPYAGNMFVTPKEVDAVINRLAHIIANALNIALHPGIDTGDVNRYLSS